MFSTLTWANAAARSISYRRANLTQIAHRLTAIPLVPSGKNCIQMLPSFDERLKLAQAAHTQSAAQQPSLRKYKCHTQVATF
jgi:hypothetical protein